MAITMPCSLWRTGCLLVLLFSSFASALQKTEGSDSDPGLNSFVSRPDIRATKWNVKVYREELLDEGYWFVGPYRILSDKSRGNGWSGAHIYDGKGELVWSGANMLSQGNIEDFRLSNVRGQYLMTLMDQPSAKIVVIDNHYEIFEDHHVPDFNSHELNFIRNGTRALVIRGGPKRASREASRAIDFDGECHVDYNRFQELDVTNKYEPVFTWSTEGHVGLDESTHNQGPVNKRCTGKHWDFIHTNSVDKTDDDDYLYSGRHTDTIYKISHTTGDIIWRLGGVKSDFPIEGDLAFSRQHDVRFRGQNETHLLLSILDNAKGIDSKSPTHEFSRGLLIAVNEKDMTASVERAYDHPNTEDRYSPRRGNYQLLPNGNVFMGWSEQGVQSEHSPDGTMLMEAEFAVDWLGTYRQYKFPWKGEPKTPPDIHSQAIGTGKDTATTIVHVSWNGATEVHSYHLYKTTASGNTTVLLASAGKTGFETALFHDGLAGRVLVNALDKDGNVLGTSGVFKTVVHDNVTAGIIDDEETWVNEGKVTVHGAMERFRAILSNPVAAFAFGFFCSAVVLVVAWSIRRRGGFGFHILRRTRYRRINSEKVDHDAFEPFTEEDDISLTSHDSGRRSLDER